MTVRYLRIISRSNTLEYGYPLFLDAAVETTYEGSMIRVKGFACGFLGGTDGVLEPFVLRKSEEDDNLRLPFDLDFGTDFEEPFRTYKTNLPTKKIDKGSQFTLLITDKEGRRFESIYEIRELIDLVSLKSLDSLTG